MNFLKIIFRKKRNWMDEIAERLFKEKIEKGNISEESFNNAAEKALKHVFSKQQSEKIKKML